MPRTHLAVRSVEVNVTAHCNLSCYGCDHAAPVHDSFFLPVEDFKRDLEKLSGVLTTTEFKLVGGEPTLHPELIEIVAAIRDSRVARFITLITNGLLLHRMPAELWRSIDFLYLSVYPGANLKISRKEVSALATRHHLHLWYKVTRTFFETLLTSPNRDASLVRRVYSTCGKRATCHTIHEGRYYKCSVAAFVPGWLGRVGLAAREDFSQDSVPLDRPDLGGDLVKYLKDENPLAACRYCLGNVGRSVAARQMTRKQVSEWLAIDCTDPWLLVDGDRLREKEAAWDLADKTGFVEL